MLNAYVHLDVRGLPRNVVDDDAFIDALCTELPDACISGGVGHPLGLTLSQFALTDRRAAARQALRARCALAEVGSPSATAFVSEVVREGLRDDIATVVASVRWRLCHTLWRLQRP
jgi:hypothetical protein